MDINKEVYSSGKVVKHYGDYSHELQVPEKTILEKLRPFLQGKRMLDIGVGGGRTTPFFAPLVKEYTGVDFAEGMVELCRSRYGHLPNAKFEVCDVRDLRAYRDGSFDFVLFSFNGLDNIAHEERMKALAEIRRICAPGAYFCFSAHNLLILPDFFKVKFRLHPVKFLRSLVKHRQLVDRNREAIAQMREAGHVRVFDNVYDFGLYTYYVRPSYQIQQLQAHGFKDVEVYNLADGKQVHEYPASEPWLYYLCRV